MHYHDTYISEAPGPASIACEVDRANQSAKAPLAMHYHEAHLADMSGEPAPRSFETSGRIELHYHDVHVCERDVAMPAIQAEPPLQALGHYHDAAVAAAAQTAWFGDVCLASKGTYIELLAKEVASLRSVYQEMAETCRRTPKNHDQASLVAA